MEYAKKRGLITSITTNGSIQETTLHKVKNSLDVISVSVDHYDRQVWEEAKHLKGIAAKAEKIIGLAKDYGMKVYAITFLNPAWTETDVEKTIRYVNDNLGVSFTLSYPYISSNYGSFIVGGELRSNKVDLQLKMTELVAKVLKMKGIWFQGC